MQPARSADPGSHGRDAVMSLSTVFILSMVSVALFTMAAYFILTKREVDYVDQPGNHSFSTSAIGQRALVNILRAVGIPTEHYRYDPDKGGELDVDKHLLVLAEPDRLGYVPAALRAFDRAQTILVVLPKRTGMSQPGERWVQSVEMLSAAQVESVAAEFMGGATVVRPSGEPPAWTTNVLAVSPDVADLQLLKSDRLTPLVGSEAGILVGEIKDSKPRVVVLSDPDPLANHGIARLENARFSVRLMEMLRPADRPLLIDETMHGFLRPPFVWSMLLERPWIVLTLSFGALLATLGLMSIHRFGPVRAAPVGLAAGKQLLIDNTARLMMIGGNAPSLIADEYFRVIRRDVADRLHAPDSAQDGEALTKWLSEQVRDPGTETLAVLSRDVETLAQTRQGSAAAAAAIAIRLHRWRREMLS